MKKTYIIPATVCVTISTQQFIATSLNSLNKEGGVVTTSSIELGSGISSDSRSHNSLWDDED